MALLVFWEGKVVSVGKWTSERNQQETKSDNEEAILSFIGYTTAKKLGERDTYISWLRHQEEKFGGRTLNTVLSLYIYEMILHR